MTLLCRFDFIIGGVHGQFRFCRAAQTERLVRAASNRFVTVIGYMTGRQRLVPPGNELNIERVLPACREHGVAVEVNGNPWRLNLAGAGCGGALSSAARSASTRCPSDRGNRFLN
jgi:DNA polymerase (family 10)